MATNEILQFASTDTGTNLLTQAEYLADSQRPIGNQPGIARAKLVNKALRQVSLIAAGIAEYIADNQSNNITDSLTPQNIADYLQAAISSGLGVTAPQFDDSTSLATTAFVQRALGSLRGYSGLSNGQVLDVNSVGKLLNITSGVTSVTLPALSGLPLGASISFVNTSLLDCTVSRAGADTISINNAVVNSIAVKSGDSITFVKATATLWLGTGTAALQGSDTFGKSLSASGYQKLPSGLIVQWGTASKPTTASPLAITFPITFPTAVLVVVPSIAGAVNPNGTAVSGGSATTSGFQAYSTTGGAGIAISYTAIGY